MMTINRMMANRAPADGATIFITENICAHVNFTFVKPCINMLLPRSISDSVSTIRDWLYTRYNIQ